MIIKAIRTPVVLPHKQKIEEILDLSMLSLKENSIVAVSSKVVSICEGNLVEPKNIDKETLVKQESDLFLPVENPKFKTTITVKNNIIGASAGVDESNGGGFYILWPKNPQKSAIEIRNFLKKKFNLKNLGVIITDSKSTILERGVIGVAIAYCGFSPINDYVGKKDLFGREFKMEKANVLASLASATVITMGEGSEQTPIAVVADIPFVKFVDKAPTKKELNNYWIDIKDDIFSPFFQIPDWKRNEKRQRKKI